MLDYPSPPKDSLAKELQDLFESMASHKKSKGSINTKKLMSKIKKLNQLFDNDDHHDSHEFLMWLLNHIAEELQAEAKRAGKPNQVWV